VQILIVVAINQVKLLVALCDLEH